MVRALIEGLKSQTRRRAIGKTGKPTLWTRVTVGDRLWVRESHRIDGTNVIYRRDGDRRTGRWRPGLHMPRWASRMTLVVQAVRQEAVSRISDADARAEGMAVRGPGPARSLFKDQGWRCTDRRRGRTICRSSSSPSRSFRPTSIPWPVRTRRHGRVPRRGSRGVAPACRSPYRRQWRGSAHGDRV